ncbi:MAG TPA: AMIN domain-containing protein, partial [Gemmatimonadales bacterium]
MRFHRWALAALAVTVAARPLPSAAPADGQVVGVSLIPAPGRAELVVSIRGAVSVRDFTLGGPTRVVLDLSGATLTTPAEPVYDGVARAGVLNVRVRQYASSVVRVVLELDRLRPYTVDRGEDQIRVIFGADEAFLAWSTGMPSRAESRPGLEERAPQPAVVAASARRRPQGQEPRITVSWDGADIKDVIAGFAALSGRTIILGKGVTGTVTAEIRDKPWSQAFQAILAAQGLSAQEMPGGIIRVDDPRVLAEIDSLEPLETRVVRVNYARAAEVSASIQGILTKGRGA